jgi:hypothetical protein
MHLKCETHANKIVWVAETIIVEFLRILFASIGVHGRNILLFVDSCAPHPQDVAAVKRTICLLIIFYKQDAYHCEWI